MIYCMLNNNSLLPGSCKCQFVRCQSTETLSPEFPDSGTLPINQTVILVMTIFIHVSHWCNDFKVRMCDWGIWLQICKHTSSKTDIHTPSSDFLLLFHLFVKKQKKQKKPQLFILLHSSQIQVQKQNKNRKKETKYVTGLHTSVSPSLL